MNELSRSEIAAKRNPAGDSASAPVCVCRICGYSTGSPETGELGRVRGNTARFEQNVFKLWKCPRCQSIHNMEAADLADIYKDYALNKRKLDIFARGTLRNLMGRLHKHGLRKTDRILDFGCGNGVLLEYLEEKGYTDIAGYDPYSADFSALPERGDGFDCVIANDVIEHVEDPRATVQECITYLKPGGLLYIGTADSAGVEDMSDLESHIMRLHQPFHRIIITQPSLLKLGADLGLEQLCSWQRSYMDTLLPFSNYRFLDEFNKALGHNMDLAFDPAAGRVILKQPRLLFYALFGYFFPSAFEPAALWRKPQ